MLPERLGSFEIMALLGEGGSAHVYAARDGSGEIALKVLHEDLYADDRHVARFLDEAERMRRVKHPGLVPVLSAGCLPGGRPFIVMPRLHGRTLAARLAEGSVPLHRALHLFDDVARALAALHAVGLVHRDIKPENVFWKEPEDRLVLLDLGIARDTAAAPSTTTRAGFQRGTPAYMAPERLFGQPATMSSDIYELALLLLLMLTAKLPWEEGDAMQRVQPRIRPEDEARLPRALQEVLLEALAFDVSKRPPTVSALLERIDAAAPAFGAAPSTPNRSSAQQAVTPFPSSPRVIVTPPSHVVANSVTPMTPVGDLEHGPTIKQPSGPFALAMQDAQATLKSAGTSGTPSHPPSGPKGTQLIPIAAPPARSSTVMPILIAVLALALGATAAFAFVLWRGGLSSSTPPTSGAARESATAMASATVDVAPAPPESAIPVVTASASASEVASASASLSASARASAGPIKEGYLPPNIIESKIHGHRSAFNGCAINEASQPNFAGGRVALNFWIGTNGRVTAASGKTSDLPKAVADCVAAQAKTIIFPAPEGGPINVITAVVFKPATKTN